MQGKSELRWSLIAIMGITVPYLCFVLVSGFPPASSFLGHVLGITGFLLMVATETLYSLRKRAIIKPWGRMQSWLKFHIFTGIVGPYLVLLHTSWSFQGMAGVVILLMGVVVLSGFVGRYIYTSVPRTADGLIVAVETIQARIRALEAELQSRLSSAPESLPRSAFLLAVTDSSFFEQIANDIWAGLFGRSQKRKLPAKERAIASQIKRMERSHREMQRQIKSIAMARRALSIWHKIHIPLGMAMFTAALIHIGAAIYYSTLLR